MFIPLHECFLTLPTKGYGYCVLPGCLVLKGYLHTECFLNINYILFRG